VETQGQGHEEITSERSRLREDRPSERRLTLVPSERTPWMRKTLKSQTFASASWPSSSQTSFRNGRRVRTAERSDPLPRRENL